MLILHSEMLRFHDFSLMVWPDKWSEYPRMSNIIEKEEFDPQLVSEITRKIEDGARRANISPDAMLALVHASILSSSDPFSVRRAEVHR